jgi:hypothetical protein
MTTPNSPIQTFANKMVDDVAKTLGVPREMLMEEIQGIDPISRNPLPIPRLEFNYFRSHILVRDQRPVQTSKRLHVMRCMFDDAVVIELKIKGSWRKAKSRLFKFLRKQGRVAMPTWRIHLTKPLDFVEIDYSESKPGTNHATQALFPVVSRVGDQNPVSTPSSANSSEPEEH